MADEPPPGYAQLAAAVLVTLQAWLKDHELPRFRFLSADITFGADVAQVGHRLAVNQSAHDLVDAWIRLTGSAPVLTEYATVTMMQAALEIAKVPWDVCSLADLGLELIGGSGGWQ